MFPSHVVSQPGDELVEAELVGFVLMAVDEGAILAGPGWATPPTLGGGEWTSPVGAVSDPTQAGVPSVVLELPLGK